eukprot:15430405-Alexandrium_andersonii.AAC.2
MASGFRSLSCAGPGEASKLGSLKLPRDAFCAALHADSNLVTEGAVLEVPRWVPMECLQEYAGK